MQVHNGMAAAAAGGKGGCDYSKPSSCPVKVFLCLPKCTNSYCSGVLSLSGHQQRHLHSCVTSRGNRIDMYFLWDKHLDKVLGCIYGVGFYHRNTYHRNTFGVMVPGRARSFY